MAGLLAIGECMMELTPQVSSQGQSGYNRAFAGDTYNALVYAKRSVSDIDAYFFTAIGTDDISNVMSSTWRQEGINPSFALPLNHATIGLYAISTDDSGERSFSYWRKDSAATQMMTVKPVDELIKACPKVNCVFFSGISLGILSEDDKALLINFVKGLRMQGVKVAFDPNYRPAMWADINHAIFWLEQAYSNSDIVLPGEEDHQALFQHQGHEAIANYCEKLGVNESVIKCGEQGTFVYQQGQLMVHQPFKPAPVQVDSTAAGDSFAGTYLAQRINNASIKTALQQATKVAGQVVQHRGAIMSTQAYNDALKNV